MICKFGAHRMEDCLEKELLCLVCDTQIFLTWKPTKHFPLVDSRKWKKNRILHKPVPFAWITYRAGYLPQRCFIMVYAKGVVGHNMPVGEDRSRYVELWSCNEESSAGWLHLIVRKKTWWRGKLGEVLNWLFVRHKRKAINLYHHLPRGQSDKRHVFIVTRIWTVCNLS